MLSHCDQYSINSGEAEAEAAETYSSTMSWSSCSRSLRKKNAKNKTRFSEEQIKSLESMFETVWRLEPQKKVDVARELGLQPRQVAIWFQNKRARWKSKQLQRDYTLLQANYKALASKFEALKKEKHALLLQLQKLNEEMQSPQDQTQCCSKGEAANSMDGESDNGESVKCEAEVKQSPSMEISEQVIGVLSDEDSSIKAEYLGLEDEHPTFLNMVDQHNTDGSLKSPEDWGKLETDGLLGQPASAYQWWDFWS